MSLRIEHGPTGRWGGRLTERPLPEHDADIDALSPEVRRKLAGIWLNRAAMERRVADSFQVISAALGRRDADAALVRLARRAVDDEFRHAELSRQVASHFAGRELASPPLLELTVPRHRGASEELRDTLHVVGQCVLNETTATAFLETCLAHAKGKLARHALRELLSDEVDHGRIGWAFLATTRPETRVELGRWLLPMAYLNLRLWREESPIEAAPPPELAAHGAPPGEVIHAALLDALSTLILPGLRKLGVPVEAVERWVSQGAFTDRAPTELLD
ncbi:MAG: hypothetical protein U0263_27850 [Polyangiaceae bacterium]